MKKKLAGWKANLLSLVGRTMLIQASSAAIPSYVMQCNQIPSKILEGIDRVNRNFLWGSSDTIRKMHWVGWRKVARPKEEGGLGLQSAKGKNTSLLAKLNWQFHTKKDAKWALVLTNKYCNSRGVNATNAGRLPCFTTWKAMKKGMDSFAKGSIWMIGRESNLSFWYGN